MKRSMLRVLPLHGEKLEDRWTPAIGSLDPTFGTNGLATLGPASTAISGGLTTVLVQADQQILTLGSEVVPVGSPVPTLTPEVVVRRTQVNGSPDLGFGVSGEARFVFDPQGTTGQTVYGAVLNDGKILIVGDTTDTYTFQRDIGIARLLSNGSLDTTFGSGGKLLFNADPGVSNEYPQGVVVLPNGQILLLTAGSPTAGVYRTLVTRLNADGSVDTSFGTAGQVLLNNFLGSDLARQADGKIVVAGSIYSGPGNTDFDFLITRLTENGAIDPSFGTVGSTKIGFQIGGVNSEDYLQGVGIDPQGNIVAVGTTSQGSESLPALARLTPNGMLDPTFDGDGQLQFQFTSLPLGGNQSAYQVTFQRSGRIVVSGGVFEITSQGSISSTAVARFRRDGSLDTIFGSGGVTILPTESVALRGLAAQNRLALLIGGTTNNNATQVARLNGLAPPELPNVYAVGADAGHSPTARMYGPDHSPLFTVEAFDKAFLGGVRVAVGDFNADGVYDLVVGTGPGVPTLVRVLDGKTQQELFRIAPFEPTFLGGVFVAAGDLNGDGHDDLVISPDEGGGPRLRVISGKDFSQIVDFFGIEDTNFRGGVRPAVADINFDGYADLGVAAGFGGGPRIALFFGQTLGQLDANGLPPKMVADFFLFEETLRNGAFLSLGDVNGDEIADIIGGGGPGGGPRVFIPDGATLLATNGKKLTEVANFFAGDLNLRGGIRVVAKDLDRDWLADVVTGIGTNSGSRVNVYLDTSLVPGTPAAAASFDAFPGFTNGVFVG